MRVAPVALAAPDDPERVRRWARSQAEVTGHTHPVGRSGAELQALAVRRALARDPDAGAVDPGSFVVALRERGREWPSELHRSLEAVVELADADPGTVATTVGSGARASRSVPAALWAFLSSGGGPEEAVVAAVSLGGDTDTVGAMAGALSGALRGASTIPERWTETLEEGPGGRSDLRELADRLHDSIE